MADKSVRIEVTGAKELRRRLKQAADEDTTAELARAYDEVRRIVVTSSRGNAPVVTGDLRDSIRGLGGKTRAQVAAGKGRTRDYSGVIHYGWPAHNIQPQPFIHEALKDDWDQVYKKFDDAINRVVDNL